HHRVHGVLQLENLALHFDGDLARQVALGDGSGHVGDVAHLPGEVGGHRVDVVSQVLPGAADARHDGLPAELAVGANLAGHAAHFRTEAVDLVHHDVDGVLQFQDLALHFDCDLARQVAARNCRGHVGDVAHLRSEVGSHRVDRVGQILPGPCHAGRLSLAAEL